MQSADIRFAGIFNEFGDKIIGHWELRHAGRWWPWMDIILAKDPEQ